MVELLAPINNFETLNAAIASGADAAYFGVKNINMRKSANNFELNQLSKLAEICHKNKIRAYLTLNTIIYDNELELLEKIIKIAKESNIDAIIAWDHAVLNLAKKYSMELHLSTQASVANFEALKSYYNQGYRRFVLARELNLNQIKSIKDKIKANNMDAEIEVFAHGAMCVSVSGRCFLSHFLNCKSANKGECLQPCRREYIIKDKETGDELEVHNNFILSPKDLSTIEILPLIIDAGVDVLKIEGRMKNSDYISKVTKVYRQAIDFIQDNNIKEITKDYQEFASNQKELLKEVFNRGFHTGFYESIPYNQITNEYGSKAIINKQYVGKVRNFYSKIKVIEVLIQSNNIKIGDTLAITGNKTGYKEFKVKEIQKNGIAIKETSKKDRVGLKIDFDARPNDKVFLLVNLIK